MNAPDPISAHRRPVLPRRASRSLMTVGALVTAVCAMLAALVLPADAEASVRVGILAPDQSAEIADVQTKLAATGSFAAVERIDVGFCSAGTPALATLQEYDAVLVWTNCFFADPDAVGDVLADYVDGGGRVVTAAFSAQNDSTGIGGRFTAGDYLPVSKGEVGVSSRLSLVPDLPNDPLLAGVDSFDGGGFSFHNNPVDVKTGSTLVASWSNGQPLVVRGPKSIFLNFFPASSDVIPGYWDARTDGAQLMANALLDGIGPEGLTFEQAQAACVPGAAAPAGYVVVDGTSRNETLRGLAGQKNLIRGLGGNDTLIGSGEDDILCGGAGNDTLQGGAGADFLFGEAGNDNLQGQGDDDVISGGLGNDALNGGAGFDIGLDTQGSNTFVSIESRTLEPVTSS